MYVLPSPLPIYVDTWRTNTVLRHLADHNTQTFAALRPVVGIPSWAIAAYHDARHLIGAVAFAVTATVAFRAV